VLLLLYSQYLANPHVFQECFSELPREKARGKTRFIGFIGFVELIEFVGFVELMGLIKIKLAESRNIGLED